MADDGSKQPEPRSPWPFRGAIPQRFARNYALYQRRGGLNDIAGDVQAYLGGEQLHDTERFFCLSLVFDQIHKEGLEGDFAELGVYKGHTAALLARQARRLGRTLWLLDTFEGFDSRDFVGLDAGRAGGFSDTSLEAVKARVGEENTRFVRGYFPDTAGQLPHDGKYCLVQIDTDLYSPIISGLEYFYPRMTGGGFMIIHDYGSLEWPGAERAVDEFFSDKPESVIPLPDSAGSAIIRRQRKVDANGNWLAARKALQIGQWHSSADGQLGYVLVEGWSIPEKWGVWGVGVNHRLQVRASDPVDGPLVLDCDVHAFIPPSAAERPVSVTVNGKPSGTWHFGRSANREIRSLTLPKGKALNTIDFRHELAVTQSDVDPKDPAARPLGIALHRIRLRASD